MVAWPIELSLRTKGIHVTQYFCRSVSFSSHELNAITNVFLISVSDDILNYMLFLIGEKSTPFPCKTKLSTSKIEKMEIIHSVGSHKGSSLYIFRICPLSQRIFWSQSLNFFSPWNNTSYLSSLYALISKWIKHLSINQCFETAVSFSHDFSCDDWVWWRCGNRDKQTWRLLTRLFLLQQSENYTRKRSEKDYKCCQAIPESW